jgi:hypothetical protein
MTELNAEAISRADRDRLRGIADVVFPRTADMPSASDVGACDTLADRVVRAVPSLGTDLHAALAATTGQGEAALIELRDRNRRLFNRLMLVIASAYYMSNEVKQRIGYEGQLAKKIDVFEVPEYLEDGTLDRVIERGPRWIDADPVASDRS